MAQLGHGDRGRSDASPLYQGDDLKGIDSADGLVADVLAFVPLHVWTLAVSIAVLRKAPAVPSYHPMETSYSGDAALWA